MAKLKRDTMVIVIETGEDGYLVHACRKDGVAIETAGEPSSFQEFMTTVTNMDWSHTAKHIVATKAALSSTLLPALVAPLDDPGQST